MHEYEQPERRLCVHMPLPLLIPILIIEERTWKYDLKIESKVLWVRARDVVPTYAGER